MRRAPSVLAVAICLSAVSCTAASADLVTSAERAAPAVPPASTTGSAPAGLHVDGKRLVNSAGEAVVLRGVNRAGTEYKCVGGGIPPGGGIFDGPVDDASIAAIKSWRANAVRIGLNEDCWLGINGVAGEYAGASYQHAIADYVSLLKANGVYAILELHWSAPGTTLAYGQQPMPDLDHSATFWSQVADAFKSDTAVIFDLFNEPYPDDGVDSAAAWSCWRDGGRCRGVPFEAAGMQLLVDVVRATGASNVIALGGLRWSNYLSEWLAYRPSDPLNNLVAAWHAYDFNTCSTVSCYAGDVAKVAAKVPVIALEIGTDSCDAGFMNSLMQWLDAHEIGYLAWTWNAGSWFSPVCSEITLISDYSGTPTVYGQIYKTHLSALP